MKHKIVLFDADGVTIDSNLMFSQVLERNYKIPQEKMAPFFSGVFQECLYGRADLKIELGNVIADWGWKKTVDELLQEWFEFENKPNAEMLHLIDRFRNAGVKCYLATNQEKHRAEYLRKKMGFSELFDGLFVSAEVGYKKKNPKFFEEVFASLNEANRNFCSELVTKNEILFVDNEKENTDSAKDAGLDTFLFTDIETFKQHMNGII
ncbi:MAG: HAD family hydrolase [Patescibacteria group bacterium]|jgi:putative hydrolase of the HAD superfamily